jgi:RNA polymerase sigma-70 factor (ECF subfamily)
MTFLVVLDTLSPPERLAFVLHDMFGMPFEEIAPVVDRSVDATRQLASRARRRVRGAREPQIESVVEQRRVVEAFLKAAREGDFEALLEVLDPDVVFRADSGKTGPRAPQFVQGSREVAQVVVERGTPVARFGRPAIVNGRPGVVNAVGDRVLAVMACTIVDGRMTEMDLVLDPEKLARVRV